MVKFSVMGFAGRDGSDVRTIAKLKAEAVPRLGESLNLYGRPFGGESGVRERRHAGKEPLRGESYFTVVDVIYDAQVDSDNEEAECGIEVHVEQAMVDRPTMKLWCVCDEPRRDERNPNMCDECGDKMPLPKEGG